MSRFGKKFRTISAVMRDETDLIDLQIRKGYFKPDEAIDLFGNDIIMVATYYGRLNVIEHMVSNYGLDIKVTNTKSGQNAIHRAVRGVQPQVIRYLWERGVSVYEQDLEWEQSPLEMVKSLQNNPEYSQKHEQLLEVEQQLLICIAIQNRWETVKTPL